MAGRPIILGLTGSIGMGKSATSDQFRRLNIPVYDADQAVHRLYAEGGAAVPLIAAAFPEAVVAGAVDRGRLSARLRGDPAAWQQLEAIIHPLIAGDRHSFLAAEQAKGSDLVVYDIPLLFEIGAEHSVDYVLLVTAPAEVQRARVLARPGMTAEKFAEILARQLPDGEKRQRADFQIDTDQGFDAAGAAVAALVNRLRHDPPPRRPDRRPQD